MNKNSRLHQKLKDTFNQLEMDYYPCFDWAFPPPGVAHSEPSSLFEQRMSEVGIYSIYLHIPFCLSVCKFCYGLYPLGSPNGFQENSYNARCPKRTRA